MCWGSPNIRVPAQPAAPAVPPRQPEEIEAARTTAELNRINLDAIKKQIEEDKTSRALFEKFTGISPTEWLAKQAQREAKLSELSTERFEKAFKGELPVSPTLTRALREEEATTAEDLRRRQIDPTSTPGIEAISRQRQRALELEDRARRGEITAAEQLGYATAASPVRPTYGSQRIYPSPPQAADLFRMGQSERMLQYQPALMGYSGALRYNDLLQQARLARGGYQAAQNQATIQGLAALGGAGAGYFSGGTRPWVFG